MAVVVKEAFLLGEAAGAGALGLYGTQLLSSLAPRPSAVDFVVGGNADNGQRADADIAKVGFMRSVPTGEPASVGDAATGEIAAIAAFGVPGGAGMPAAITDFFLFSEASNSASRTSVGSDASVLTDANANVARVAGPLGTDFAVRFDGTANKILRRAMSGVAGDPLQTGLYDWCLFGAVKVTNLPTGGTQQVYFGQIEFDPAINLGACCYTHATGTKPQADVCAAGDRGLAGNLALIGSTTITAAAWGHFLVTFKASTNTFCLYYNGVLEKRWTPTALPEPATAVIAGGSATKFTQVPQLDEAGGTSGYEGGRSYLYHATPPAALKCVHGTDFVSVLPFKLPDVTTTQTLEGIYTKVGGAKINRVWQVSAGYLYFLAGDGAGGYRGARVAVSADTFYIPRAWVDFAANRVKLRLLNTGVDGAAGGGVSDDLTGFTVGYPAGAEYRIGAATHADTSGNADEWVRDGLFQAAVIGTGAADATFDTKANNGGAGTLDWGPSTARLLLRRRRQAAGVLA